MTKRYFDALYGELLEDTTVNDKVLKVELNKPLPILEEGEWFTMVLEDHEGNIEILKVTATDGANNTITVDRGQDNTVNGEWSKGSHIGLRAVASDFININSSLSNLDLDALSNGRIVVMRTPKGQPTHMYRIPQFNCEDIDPSGELGTGVHPAFLFNGTPEREIFVGVYLASEVNGEIVSQPGKEPRTGLTFDQSRQKCRDLGAGWDIMSNWDWAAIALWCMANGFQPRGNTQTGRSHDRRFETGSRLSSSSRITLTGSGPVSWNHDNTSTGISDLVGNVSEWNSGLILREGLFEVVPDNGSYDESQYIKTDVFAALEGTFSNRSYTTPTVILRQCLAIPTNGVAPLGYFWRDTRGERLTQRGISNAMGRSGLGCLEMKSIRSAFGNSTGFRPRFRKL